MIELKNLTKRFGNVVAVNRLNLSVSEGEIFGSIGPNGAGKTTTLRMMGGVLAPTEGTVMINGIDMAENLSTFTYQKEHCKTTKKVNR